MAILFLLATLLILVAVVLHAVVTRGGKWAAIFGITAAFFGLWHELNPLREADPEYFFAHAIKLGGVPVVGVIGWIEIFYLSWFLVDALLPQVFRTRILVWPALISAVVASLFALCIETTGIAMEWWIWREDRQSILFPMGGWASQTFLYSSLFFGMFHSTYRTKILLLLVLALALPTFHPSIERQWYAAVMQAVAVFAFVFFARFESRTWIRTGSLRKQGIR